MNYYQRKALEVRDLALAHPWGEVEQRALEEALRDVALDQRVVCGSATEVGCDCHKLVMNAEIEQDFQKDRE